MNDTNAYKKEKKNYILKRLIDISLAVIIAGGAIFAIKAVSSDFTDIDRTKENSEESIVATEASTPDPSAMIYVTEMADNQSVYSGPLIVVNNQTEYKGTEDNLVSMYDILQQDGTKDYLVMSSDVKVRADAAEALNNMVKAFASETGHKDIIVDGGYRSVSYQQELYDAAEDKSAAAQPGFSDYHTGYSVDFSISQEDGSVLDFAGTEDYAWFENNCYRYGFVLRFPEGKKELTGYDYRPWHFRYVGLSHAFYMYTNNLCLEEYVAKLKDYEYTKTHLTFTDDNGNKYETYYYPMDASTSSSIIAVPDAEYQVSGNNTDGFIITFCLSTPAAPEETAPASTDASAASQPASSEAVQTEVSETLPEE